MTLEYLLAPSGGSVTATLAAPLGALSATASAAVGGATVTATMAAPLGALSAHAAITRVVLVTLAAPLGGLGGSILAGGGQPYVKVAGTFGHKAFKRRSAGTFTPKPMKVRVAGSFVAAL